MKQSTCLSLVISLALWSTACNRSGEKTAEEARRRDQLQDLFRDQNEELNDKRVELDRLTHRDGDPDSPDWKAKCDALSQQIRGLGAGKASVTNVISELQMRRDKIVTLYGNACPPLPDPLLVKQLIEQHPELQHLRNEMSQLWPARLSGTLTTDDPIRRELRQIHKWANATQDQLDEVRAHVRIEVEAQLASRSFGDSPADAIEQIDSASAQWYDVVRMIDAQIAKTTESLKEFEQQTAMIQQRALEVERLVEMTKSLSAKLKSLE